MKLDIKGNSDILAKQRDGNDPIVLQPRRCMFRHSITEPPLRKSLIIKEIK